MHNSDTPASSLRVRWMTLTAALLGWMFDGFEMGLFPLVARPALNDLLTSTGTQPDLINGLIGIWTGRINASFLLGAAAGGVFFGWLGDRFGRVRAMCWSILVYALFSGLCGFAQSPIQIAALRFIASLGMGGEWALGVALVVESWPNASRPFLAGLIGAAANVGYLLIGVISIFLGKAADGSGWRYLMFIGVAPAFLTLFIRMFVPESEKWKHAAQTSPRARVADIFVPRLIKASLLATLLASIALIGTWGSVQWVASWADKLTTDLVDRPANVRAWTQICSSAGAVVGTIFAAFLAQWLSRRLAYFLLALASLLACGYLFGNPLLANWLPGPTTYGAHFLIVVGIVGALTASFYGWLPLYLPELFPTRVRATGQGFAFNMGRVAAAGGALLSGELVRSFNENYAEMCWRITLVYLVGLVAIWFCPETRGKPLPE